MSALNCLFCLSLHTSLSICMSLTVLWMLYTCPVTHECVIVSHLWLILMTQPVYLVIQPGPITKSTQVYVCVCVCKTWPRGIQPTCHCGKVLLGLISVFRMCPVQVKTVDPSVWVGWVKPTETDSGWSLETGTESMLAGEKLWGEAWLSVKTFLTLTRQKVRLIAQNSGIQERKQPAYSKNKSVLTSSTATRSK